MNERTVRTRLRKSGWSTTNYPCVTRLLYAGMTGHPVMRTYWTTGSGTHVRVHDHHKMACRMLRVLGLEFTEADDRRSVILDERAMKLLGGVKHRELCV